MPPTLLQSFMLPAALLCLAAGLQAAQPVRVNDPADAAAKQPQAAVDESGRVYVAYGVGDTVKCAVSVDSGQSFQSSAVGSPGLISLGMRRGPRIAATGGSVVVSAIGGETGKGRDGDVVAWRSTDQGKTWAQPVQVNSVKGSAREGLHAMAAGPNGLVFCVWLDLRNKRTELFGARSTNGGQTWEADRLIYQSPDRSICECCHPSVVISAEGTIHVMWRNSVKGARDMYLATSTDGGQSFPQARKLGRGTWALNACPMDGGAVAVGPGDQVETIWMRAGSIFTAQPGADEKRLGKGVQGWAASGHDGTYKLWLEGRNGRLMLCPPGSDSATPLAEQANDPVIAAAPGGKGPVVAVWESKAGTGELLGLILSK